MTAIIVAFVLISIVMVVSAVLLVTTDNVVHAVLYLMLVLAGTAGIFILFGAEFLGWTQVLVYLGAIVVLMLFGVMLTKAEYGHSDALDHDPQIRWASLVVGLAIGALFVGVFVESLGGGDDPDRGTGTLVYALETPDGELIPQEVTTDVGSIDLRIKDDDVPEEIEVLAIEGRAYESTGGDLAERLAEFDVVVPEGALSEGAGVRYPVVEEGGEQVLGVVVWQADASGSPVFEGEYEVTALRIGGATVPIPEDADFHTVSVTVCDYLGGQKTAFRALGVPVAGLPILCPTQVDEVASDLFTRWVLPFEAVSLVLLAALIGGVVLGRRDDPDHVRPRVPQEEVLA